MTALLPPGSRIGVVATSHAFFEDRFQQGLRWIRAQGYEIVEAPTLRSTYRYFAGNDQNRLASFVWAMTAPDLDAVWIARGGSGITRLLPNIPWSDLQPRPVIGFSDATPLLDQLMRRAFPAVHGPVVHSLGLTSAESLAHLCALLQGPVHPPLVGIPMVDGVAEGRLVGGNLCMLASTCGTPFQIDATGSILVLEEIGEAPYKIGRMLEQLGQAGVFQDVAGIALGSFTSCDPPQDADWSLDQIFEEHFVPLGVPVLRNLPVGHGPDNHAFVVGAQARIADGRIMVQASEGRAAAPPRT